MNTQKTQILDNIPSALSYTAIQKNIITKSNSFGYDNSIFQRSDILSSEEIAYFLIENGFINRNNPVEMGFIQNYTQRNIYGNLSLFEILKCVGYINSQNEEQKDAIKKDLIKTSKHDVRNLENTLYLLKLTENKF